MDTFIRKRGRVMRTFSEVEFTEYDQYLFGQGTHYAVHRKLGAHPAEKDGRTGVYFAVWAPHAAYVSVVGSFNDWDRDRHPMFCDLSIGVWTAFIPEAKAGDLYKYLIVAPDGRELYKADPYAAYAEMRPGTASIVWDTDESAWTDDKWLKKRTDFDIDREPMVIYECHIGSWMKHPEADGREQGFYNYREFAERIADYLLDMQYTHLELLGIAEHPFDGSWGYQVTGYFAPTSRYGTPDDFRYMIDYLHNKGIGVILDWVPAHFPRDMAGLAEFDGTCLYEHPDPRLGEHPDWGTKIFNYGCPEVSNFLIASALHWIEDYHIDGLRVDAVASMLYLDYGRRDGAWVPNIYGENKNLEAIEFFRHLNSLLMGRHKGVVMIAEESTAWPQVTGDVTNGSLGFALKWNMGWMNDFLEYMKLDPYFRKYNHHKMTFSTSYAYSEKYVLVLSHDEVVHLKCSMLEKMPGLDGDKFANLRAAYLYMLGHPGKKLLFMGQEFAQRREWSEERELDWYLLSEPLHAGMKDYVRELWRLYRKYPALYATDYDPQGFEWINADDCDRSIYSFMRKTEKGKNLLFVLNMTPVRREDYRVGVPHEGIYRLILNAQDPKFGGSHYVRRKTYHAALGECDRRPYYLAYDLPPYGCAVFEFDAEDPSAAGKAASPAVKKPAAKKAKKSAAKKTTTKKAAGPKK